MPKVKIPLWTLEQALELVRKLQPKLKRLNYHVVLGGGVLNTGVSYNDLDLYFLPFNNGKDSHPAQLLVLLMKEFGAPHPLGTPTPDKDIDTSDYEPPAPWINNRHTFFLKNTKRIDVFVA